MKKEKLPIWVLILFFSLISVIVIQQWLYHNTIHLLTTIKPATVTTFKIYPGFRGSINNFREFKMPNSLVEDFFHALTDIHAYSPNDDTIHEEERAWFLEFATQKTTIQLSCYIPSREDDIVVGHVGKFFSTGMISYGYFQSQQLFQWYQKYSHLWLTSIESTPHQVPSN